VVASFDVPETRYVRLDGADIAYQVVGDGPIDLLYCRGTQHLELLWDHPASTAFLRSLASFSRLILFDRRGWGASDPFPHGATATWEGWAEDIAAVLHAVGSERTALFAEMDAGPISVLYAASHPERTRALILANTSAREVVDADYPIGRPVEALDAMVDMLEHAWGSPELIGASIPSRVDDHEFLTWAAKVRRASATPRSAAAQHRYMWESMDVRTALPLIHVPTLVLHNSGNRIVPVEHGRYLADHIAGAKLVEYPSDDAFFYADRPEPVIEEIAQFLTGEPIPFDVDRVLTTVLFTDIVGSTQRAVALGDRGWRSLLNTHDSVVQTAIDRHRGQLIKLTGDGVLATFDGPGRAIRCALAVKDALAPLGIEIRAGLHSGEVELRGDDIGGIGVHVAARVLDQAAPGELLASGALPLLVAGSGIEFEERGEHTLKGVPGAWRLFAVSP
jgi:class 3 adenylate cyclase